MNKVQKKLLKILPVIGGLLGVPGNITSASNSKVKPKQECITYTLDRFSDDSGNPQNSSFPKVFGAHLKLNRIGSLPEKKDYYSVIPVKFEDGSFKMFKAHIIQKIKLKGVEFESLVENKDYSVSEKFFDVNGMSLTSKDDIRDKTELLEITITGLGKYAIP